MKDNIDQILLLGWKSFRDTDFGGLSLPGPSKYKEVLVDTYGEDYMIPKKDYLIIRDECKYSIDKETLKLWNNIEIN